MTTLLNTSLLLYLFTLLITLPHLICSLRISGEWTNTELATILVKFGFQKTEPLYATRTLGYIYGNVTDKMLTTTRSEGKRDAAALPGKRLVLLVLITQNMFEKFRRLVRGGTLLFLCVFVEPRNQQFLLNECNFVGYQLQ